MPTRPLSSRSLSGVEASLVFRLLSLARRRELPFVPVLQAADHPTASPALRRALREAHLAGEQGVLDALESRLEGGADGAGAGLLRALRRVGLPADGLRDLAAWFAERATERGRFLGAVVYPLALALAGCIAGGVILQGLTGGQLVGGLGTFVRSETQGRHLARIVVELASTQQSFVATPAGAAAWFLLVAGAALLILWCGLRLPDHALALAVPGLKRVVRIRTARSWASTLHLLLRGGVPAPEALALAADGVPNARLGRDLRALAERVSVGDGAGELLRACTALPPSTRWRLWAAYFRSDLTRELAAVEMSLTAELAVTEKRIAAAGTLLAWLLALLAFVPLGASILFVYSDVLRLFSVMD